MALLAGLSDPGNLTSVTWLVAEQKTTPTQLSKHALSICIHITGRTPVRLHPCWFFIPFTTEVGRVREERNFSVAGFSWSPKIRAVYSELIQCIDRCSYLPYFLACDIQSCTSSK